MQKITDTLYIQQDALVRYAMIQLDLSGAPHVGNQYRIVLQLAGSKDPVQVCRSAAIEVLLPKLRLIANRLSLRRLTDTLYVHANVPIRMLQAEGGHVKVLVSEDETLDGWPTAIGLDDACAMIADIAGTE
jgi:hypothetical protein